MLQSYSQKFSSSLHFLSLLNKMTDILLTILSTIFFIWLIKKISFYNIEGISFKILVGLFILKILAGIGVIYIYSHYYSDRLSSDIFKYFDDGNILFSALKQNPIDYVEMLTGIGSDSPHLMKYYDKMGFWIKPFDYNLYNDNRTVIRFNAFVRLFSFGSIYVHNVVINFLSFTGFVAILKVFISYFKKYEYLLIFSIFLVPTTIFWSSGLLKEGILMFAFGMFFYFTIELSKQFEYKKLIGLMLAILLLSISKFYVLVAAVPGVLTYIYLKKSTHRFLLLKFIATHLIFFLFAINFHYIAPQYDLLQIISNKQHDFENMLQEAENVGSYYEIPVLEPTVFSFVKNSPIAFWNTLTRPFITEAHSAVILIAALENIFILLCILITIIFFSKRYLKEPIIYLLVSFVIIQFVLYGLTTPVMGALVRYKMPALPFLFVLLMFLTDLDKISSYILQLKRKIL